MGAVNKTWGTPRYFVLLRHGDLFQELSTSEGLLISLLHFTISDLF